MLILLILLWWDGVTESSLPTLLRLLRLVRLSPRGFSRGRLLERLCVNRRRNTDSGRNIRTHILHWPGPSHESVKGIGSLLFFSGLQIRLVSDAMNMIDVMRSMWCNRCVDRRGLAGALSVRWGGRVFHFFMYVGMITGTWLVLNCLFLRIWKYKIYQ